MIPDSACAALAVMWLLGFTPDASTLPFPVVEGPSPPSDGVVMYTHTSGDEVGVSAWYRDAMPVPGLSGGGNVSGSTGSEVDVSWGGGAAAREATIADVGCSAQIGTGIWSADLCPLMGESTGDDPGLDPDAPEFVAPSTWDILREGLATAAVEGAGVVVQPEGDSYVGVPTLVHAAETSRTVSVVVLGVSVPIRLEAQSFSFDFDDGSSPLVTDNPGGPYPVRTNQHTYSEEQEAVGITLETTWGASVVNPFTGEALSVDGVVVTREVSRSFAVVRAHTVVTDLAEERLGR